MNSTTKITLNLQHPNVAVMVFAVQNDRLSRFIEASLWDGADAWTPPAGALPMIRCLKPDGNGCYYDTDENSDPAISITGNVATMTLAEQCTTVPGDCFMELNFYTAAGDKLTTFRWVLRVQQSVLDDATIISSSYYNVLTALAAQVASDAADVAAAAAQITIPMPVASGGTGSTTAAGALTNLGALSSAYAPIHVTGTMSANTLTISDAAITADMRVLEASFGTPSAILSDVTWTTSAGSIALAANVSGSTTVDLILGKTD